MQGGRSDECLVANKSLLSGVRLEFIINCLNKGGWVEGKQNYC